MTATSQPSVETLMESARFILGVYNVEDILLIPGTQWVVGGGITSYGPGANDKVITKGYFHLFDAEKEDGGPVNSSGIAIRPDSTRYPQTAAPDWETFSPHGISFGKQEGQKIELFACNHGGRESVEAFEIDFSGNVPRFSWLGAVVAPEDFWPDAVAWIPDGSLCVTSLGSPLQDPEEAQQAQLKGAPIGATRIWDLNGGWRDLEGAEWLSTPNGVLISPDGSKVFVAASSGFSVNRIDRSVFPVKLESVDVGGIPDNLRWTHDGKAMFCGVHTADPFDFAKAQAETRETGGNLYTPFKILRIDTETLEATEVMPSAVYGALGGGTGAIEVGSRLWVSSTKSDRIGIFTIEQ